MNRLYFILISFVCLFGVSCQQNEELQDTAIKNESRLDESVMENVKFVPVTQRFENVSTRAIAAANTRSANPSKTNLIILQFDDWGRTSKGCHGFGLCHVIWFPSSSVSDKYLNELGPNATILELDDSNRQYYMDLLLAESAPIKNGELLPTLKVDQNLQLEANEELLKPLYVKKGEYEYNAKLGEFGGFRVSIAQK